MGERSTTTKRFILKFLTHLTRFLVECPSPNNGQEAEIRDKSCIRNSPDEPQKSTDWRDDNKAPAGPENPPLLRRRRKTLHVYVKND